MAIHYYDHYYVKHILHTTAASEVPFPNYILRTVLPLFDQLLSFCQKCLEKTLRCLISDGKDRSSYDIRCSKFPKYLLGTGTPTAWWMLVIRMLLVGTNPSLHHHLKVVFHLSRLSLGPWCGWALGFFGS